MAVTNRKGNMICINAEDVHLRIAEFAEILDDPGTDPIAQVEAALFIEEVFGLTLADADMTAEKLGTHAAIEEFVIERMGLK